MQDFVRVGIADAAKKTRIGKRALQRVIFAQQPFTECLQVGIEGFETAHVERRQLGFAMHHVERSALLRPCLGKGQSILVELECRQRNLRRWLSVTL